MPYGCGRGTGNNHSMEATTASVHDITEASKLTRPDDEVVYGDAGYLGLDKRPEIMEDALKSQIDYRIAPCPGKKRSIEQSPARWYCPMEYQKAAGRAKVEHPLYFSLKIHLVSARYITE